MQPAGNEPPELPLYIATACVAVVMASALLLLLMLKS